MAELLQVALERECLTKLRLPPATPQAGIGSNERYVLRLSPKGAAADERADYFIGDETKRLLYRLARQLASHYDLAPDQALPAVEYTSHGSRPASFPARRYIFQASGRGVAPAAVHACVRFLTHGLGQRDENGRVTLNPAPIYCAIYLPHTPFRLKNTTRHRRPDDASEKHRRERLLRRPNACHGCPSHRYISSSVAMEIDGVQALERAPSELRQAYDDAKTKAGTLSEVIGGV